MEGKKLADRVLDETTIIEWSEMHELSESSVESLLSMYRNELRGEDPLGMNPNGKKRLLLPAYQEDIRPYLRN